MTRLIDHLSGTGDVFQGDGYLGRASYRLRIYQHYIQAHSHTGFGEIPGLKEIKGTILIDGLQPGSRARLHLWDGRKLDFQLVDFNGNIIVMGGLN